MRRKTAPSLPPTRARGRDANGGAVSLPERPLLAQRVFGAYARRYLARHFHAVRVLRDGGETAGLEDAPVFVYPNHASWWDPLLGLVLSLEALPGRRHRGLIDAEALERYPLLRKLGFIGLSRGRFEGARAFVRAGEEAARRPRAVLWVTPQGRFADPRERPPRFDPGIGRLARRLARPGTPPRSTPDPLFLPLALEYPFWEERCPEALAAFGAPVASAELGGLSAEECTRRLEMRLQETQERLAAASMARDAGFFRTVVAGSAGTGALYDAWRWLRAKLSRREFRRRHGRIER